MPRSGSHDRSLASRCAEVRIGPHQAADITGVRNPQSHADGDLASPTGLEAVLVDDLLDGLPGVTSVDGSRESPERVAGTDRYAAPGSGVGFRGCRAGRPGNRSEGDDHDQDEEATQWSEFRPVQRCLLCTLLIRTYVRLR
jgi:hypothetical protein